MRNNKGFTLVEVIISIAALGVICAVMLQLFVLAGNTNRKAGDMQDAELGVSSVVETLAGADTLSQGLDTLGIGCSTPPSDAEFSLPGESYNIVIEIHEEDGEYPGTLYSIHVTASDDDNELAAISTAKYEKDPSYE